MCGSTCGPTTGRIQMPYVTKGYHTLHITLLQVTQHTSCSFIIIIIQPSNQQASEGMHNVCEKNYEKVLRLMQTPIRPWLPSAATLLFNIPKRDMLLKFSRPPILCKNDKKNLTEIIDNPI